jgi:bacterial leucyl aminopeptidase
MTALVLALAVLSGASAPGRAPADVWITIERDVLDAFERGGEAWEATPNFVGDPLAPRAEVIAATVPETKIDALAAFIHERERKCGGFIAHGSREEALYAASRAAYSGVVERMPPPVPYTIDNGSVARALAAAVQETTIRQTITDLAAFFTRYHNCASGNASALSIRDKWLAYAAGRSDVTVELFTHSGYTTQQPSVILTIMGTTLPSEVVVLGAHQDSVAGSNCSTSRSPGADDDASGVATITEVIRVAMALDYQPQRTVKFMAYAAEEVGLRGSNQIAQTYVNQGINVIGVVQFDMTNYSDVPNADIVFYNDFTNAAQNEFLKDLANTYVTGDVATIYQPRLTSQCGYGCSDHAAWHNRGFVASFPFEAPFGDHSPFIHSSQDTLGQSGGHANRTVPFAKLGAAYMAEIAKGAFTALAPSRTGAADLAGARR